DYLAQWHSDLRLNEVADPQSLSLVELQAFALPLPADRLLKALELDADRSALYAGYRTQAKDKENIIGIAKLDRKLRCRMSLLSSYLMTFLFEQINRRMVLSSAGSH